MCSIAEISEMGKVFVMKVSDKRENHKYVERPLTYLIIQGLNNKRLQRLYKLVVWSNNCNGSK